jgi:hypothetical protein
MDFSVWRKQLIPYYACCALGKQQLKATYLLGILTLAASPLLFGAVQPLASLL